MQRERELFILARLRIAQGNPSEAVALVEQCLPEATRNGRTRSQVQALCLQAMAGRPGEASWEPLARALALGHEKGFRRLFLDEGLPLAELVRAALPALSGRGLRLYATTLLQAFGPGAAPREEDGKVPDLVEPLSQQELRVLRLLAAGLSNAEIASELVVSLNTVKTHVKSIYRKLDINSREDARAVAKELKLL